MLAAEKFDLLLADVQLRGFNGLHLVRQVRHDRPEMAAMIMTGYDDTLMELEAGVRCGFIRKPIEPGPFLEAVTKSLADVRRERRWRRKTRTAAQRNASPPSARSTNNQRPPRTAAWAGGWPGPGCARCGSNPCRIRMCGSWSRRPSGPRTPYRITNSSPARSPAPNALMNPKNLASTHARLRSAVKVL